MRVLSLSVNWWKHQLFKTPSAMALKVYSQQWVYGDSNFSTVRFE